MSTFRLSTLHVGWPLWFAPASGYTATKAEPQPMVNVNNNMGANQLFCHDSYRNITACTMKCKRLPTNRNVTSIDTIDTHNFTEFKCTLDMDTTHILRIPVDNYLIYFTDWTSDLYNLSCLNATGMATSQMLCRYEVDEFPFWKRQCLSTNMTSRYIPPGELISLAISVTDTGSRLCQ
jgi:hypothetical protein